MKTEARHTAIQHRGQGGPQTTWSELLKHCGVSQRWAAAALPLIDITWLSYTSSNITHNLAK